MGNGLDRIANEVENKPLQLLPHSPERGAIRYKTTPAENNTRRRLQNDARRQQVFFRVFYRHKGGIEVRQAALIRMLNTNGKIVAA